MRPWTIITRRNKRRRRRSSSRKRNSKKLLEFKGIVNIIKASTLEVDYIDSATKGCDCIIIIDHRHNPRSYDDENSEDTAESQWYPNRGG